MPSYSKLGLLTQGCVLCVHQEKRAVYDAQTAKERQEDAAMVIVYMILCLVIYLGFVLVRALV